MSSKAIEVGNKVHYIKGSQGWYKFKDALFTVVEDLGFGAFLIDEDDGNALIYAHGGLEIEPVEVEGKQDGSQ